MKQKSLRKTKKHKFMFKKLSWHSVLAIAVVVFFGYVIYKNIPPNLTSISFEPTAADAAGQTSIPQLRERVKGASDEANKNVKSAKNWFVFLRSTKAKYLENAEQALQAGARTYSTAASYYGADAIAAIEWNPAENQNLRGRVSDTVLTSVSPQKKTVAGVVTPVLNQDKSTNATYGVGIRQADGTVVKISSTKDNSFPDYGTPVEVSTTSLSNLPRPSSLSIRGTAPFNTATTAFTVGNTTVAGSSAVYNEQLSSGETLVVVPVGSTDPTSAKSNAQRAAAFYGSQTGGKVSISVELASSRQDCNGTASGSYVMYVTSSFSLPGCTSSKGPYPATENTGKILVPNAAATMAHELGHALGLVGYYQPEVVDADGHLGAGTLNIMNTNGSFNTFPPLTAAQIAKITNSPLPTTTTGPTGGTGVGTGATGTGSGGTLGNPPPVPAGTAMNCPSPITAAPGTSFAVPITGSGNSFAIRELISVDRSVAHPGWLRQNADPSLGNYFIPGDIGAMHLEVGSEAPEGASGTIGLYVLITNYVQGGTWDYNPIRMTCRITVNVRSSAGNPYPPEGPVTPNQTPGTAKGPNGLYAQLQLEFEGRPLHGNFCDASLGLGGCTTESFERDYVNPPNTPRDPNAIVVPTGSTVIVRWTSEKAVSCSVAPNGWTGVVGSGSLIDVQNYMTVRLTCTNAQGQSVTATRSISAFGQATNQTAKSSVCQPSNTVIGIPENFGGTERDYFVDMVFPNGTNLANAQTSVDFVQLAENPRLEYRSSSVNGSTIRHNFHMYIPAGPYKRGNPQMFITVTQDGKRIGHCEAGATYNTYGTNGIPTPTPGGMRVTPDSVQVRVGETKTITVSGGTTPYSIAPQSQGVYEYFADVSLEGATLTITGNNPGSTVITLIDSYQSAFGTRSTNVGVVVLPAGTTAGSGGSGSGAGSGTGGGGSGAGGSGSPQLTGCTTATSGPLTLTCDGAVVVTDSKVRSITVKLNGSVIATCEQPEGAADKSSLSCPINLDTTNWRTGVSYSLTAKADVRGSLIGVSDPSASLSLRMQ